MPDTNRNEFDESRLNFQSTITEAPEHARPYGRSSPADAPEFTVMPSEHPTQQHGTLVAGRRRDSDRSQHRILLRDDDTVELGASETSNFATFGGLDNTQVIQLLPLNVYRKIARISSGISALAVGKKTACDALIGITSVEVFAAPYQTIRGVMFGGQGQELWYEYTSKEALYAIALVAPDSAVNQTVMVMDESYEGAPQIG